MNWRDQAPTVSNRVRVDMRQDRDNSATGSDCMIFKAREAIIIGEVSTNWYLARIRKKDPVLGHIHQAELAVEWCLNLLSASLTHLDLLQAECLWSLMWSSISQSSQWRIFPVHHFRPWTPRTPQSPAKAAARLSFRVGQNRNREHLSPPHTNHSLWQRTAVRRDKLVSTIIAMAWADRIVTAHWATQHSQRTPV